MDRINAFELYYKTKIACKISGNLLKDISEETCAC